MEEKEEIWKDVVGYEGLYRVSSFGRVFGVKANKILSPALSRGYRRIKLSQNGICKPMQVHALVVEAFIDKYYKERNLVVNHKDFNRQNNKISNLEIVTWRENGNRKHLPSVSKYTGVTKHNNRWISKIMYNKKTIHLGSFESEIEASQYYECALICINENRIGDIRFKEKIEPNGYSHNGNAKFRVRATLKGKNIHLGYYDTQEEAREAYLKFKKEHA